MYCSSCGKPMPGVRMRCPACRAFTPASGLNLFCLALWAVIVGTNWLYAQYFLPTIVKFATDLNMALPLIARLHIGALDFGATYGLWILAGGILLLLVLWWRKVTLPNFLKSGKLLAGLTWLGLAGTAAGVLFGSAPAFYWLPQVTAVVLELRPQYNELAAVEALKAMVAAETAYRQKNPGVGFTCNLPDLRAFTATTRPPRTRLGKEDPFDGGAYGYDFYFQGCAGKPSPTYQVVAVPISPPRIGGRYAFCSDPSGIIYYAPDGKRETCLEKRAPLY